MPIDTLANVTQALGMTSVTEGESGRLDALRGAADAFISAHCGRAFAGGTFTEYHPGGGRVLFLANFPVTGVTSLKVDPLGGFGAETLRDPSGYVVHPDRGLVESRGGAFIPPRPGFRVAAGDFPRAVQVVYTTATDAAPADVKQAYADLIGHWFRLQNTHAELSQTDKLQATAGGTVTAYPWGVSGGFRVPAGVLQLLANYRVPVL